MLERKTCLLLPVPLSPWPGDRMAGLRPPELMGHLNSHCAFVAGSACAGCCLLVLRLVLGQITRNFLENTTRVQDQACALPG